MEISGWARGVLTKRILGRKQAEGREDEPFLACHGPLGRVQQVDNYQYGHLGDCPLGLPDSAMTSSNEAASIAADVVVVPGPVRAN